MKKHTVSAIFVFSHLLILIVAIFNRCTEPYEIENNEYENILVVRGVVTNEVGPYKVVLSKTFPLNSDSIKYESDAIVTITDKYGNVEILFEDEPGVYITNPGFLGEIGNQYQLRIVTSDDTEYESQIVNLFQGLDIERTYTEYREVYDFDRNIYLPGVDFKLDTKKWNNDLDEEIYLKWEYEEVWEIEQKWNKIEIIPGKPWNDYEHDTIQVTCWKYDYSFDIILDKASNYESNQIRGNVLYYLNKESPKPYYGYSVLIKQFTINESAYKYWEMMEENNIDNGALFDNVPYNAKSNIECCNGDKKVYGYFDASYVSQIRMFFKTPIKGVDFRDINGACKVSSIFSNRFHELYSYASIVLMEPADDDILWLLNYTIQDYCVDCSVVSTTKEKPDFWIY